MQSVFTDARRKQSIAATEFRQFRERAILEIPAICGSLDRFAELEREFSFRIDELDEQDHLQCSFGSRSMDIRDSEGKLAIEKGPRLVYSLSRTGGLMMTDLFSASSTLGRVSEDHVSLRTGSYSAYQLLTRLRSDIRLLVSYTFISSLETTPSIRDRFDVWWMRKTHPHSKGAIRRDNAGASLVAGSVTV